MKVCQKNNLDGLVMIGHTHTLTDAFKLTNYFLENKCKTRVVTVPCAVAGNLYHKLLETTIGFDTSSKVYS